MRALIAKPFSKTALIELYFGVLKGPQWTAESDTEVFSIYHPLGYHPLCMLFLCKAIEL